MARRLRTTLPIAQDLLKAEAHMRGIKDKQKYYYDRRGTKELPGLKFGDYVRVVSKEWKATTVVQHHTSLRSYVIDAGGQESDETE